MNILIIFKTPGTFFTTIQFVTPSQGHNVNNKMYFFLLFWGPWEPIDKQGNSVARDLPPTGSEANTPPPPQKS